MICLWNSIFLVLLFDWVMTIKLCLKCISIIHNRENAKRQSTRMELSPTLCVTHSFTHSSIFSDVRWESCIFNSSLYDTTRDEYTGLVDRTDYNNSLPCVSSLYLLYNIFKLKKLTLFTVSTPYMIH